MKILIDDIGRTISQYDKNVTGEEFVTSSYYEFDDLVKEVLTTTQYETFIGYDTRRVFTISKKKETVLRNFKK